MMAEFGSGWMGGFGMGGLGMLLFWGLAIAAVVMLIRSLGLGGNKTAPATPDAAAAILNERYARGELSTEQLAEMKRALRGDA